MIRAYLEMGRKRWLAGAVDWPGWARFGRDEDSALETLLHYGERYADALAPAGLEFVAPTRPQDIAVVERLTGSPTTDFGAIEAAPTGDEGPLEGRDLERAHTILLASWGALDHAVEAVEAAGGRELARGPRGGGRSLRAVIGHVAEAERAYLSRLGRPATPGTDRTAILDALADVGPIGTPPPGPRGGRRWSARFFVRRACWHALDHAWEIEDRTTPA